MFFYDDGLAATHGMRQLWPAAFSPDYFELLAPTFVEGDEGPVDVGGEIAEDGLGGGVDAECRGGEVEAWGIGREAQAGEVAVALELA